MKTRKSVVILPILLALSACGGGQSTPSGPVEPVIDEHYYEKISERVAFDENNAKNFNDEMTGGPSNKVWDTLDAFWENGGKAGWHNGVRRRNIFKTTDEDGNGYLVLKARGQYNKEDPTKPKLSEGACLRTKEFLGPGRYEIEMAPLPRDGAVSAYWTYGTTTGSEDTSQLEIDIELGGSANYTNIWCTSWTKKASKTTENIDVSDKLFMNDGKMHKYTFDWYTSYPGTNEPRVDWFIDEQYVTSITGGVVPTTHTPLWLGLWCPSWSGSGAFEVDYMLVGRASYKSFDSSTQRYKRTSYNIANYNKMGIDESNIQTIDYSDVINVNKISNADCESLEEYEDNNYFGWQAKDVNRHKGTISLSDDHTHGSKSFLLAASTEETQATRKKAHYFQSIKCTYSNFKYKFSYDAKRNSADTVAYVELKYENDATKQTETLKKINVTTDAFASNEEDITLPKNAKELSINLVCENGSVNFDNFKLIFLGA